MIGKAFLRPKSSLKSQNITVAKSLRAPNGWKQLTNNGVAIPCLDLSTRWRFIYEMLQSVRDLREILEEKDVGNARGMLTNKE